MNWPDLTGGFILMVLGLTLFLGTKGHAMSQPAKPFHFDCTVADSSSGQTNADLCAYARDALLQVLPAGMTLTDRDVEPGLKISLRETRLGLILDMTYTSATQEHRAEQRELTVLDHAPQHRIASYQRFFAHTFSTLFD